MTEEAGGGRCGARETHVRVGDEVSVADEVDDGEIGGLLRRGGRRRLNEED